MFGSMVYPAADLDPVVVFLQVFLLAALGLRFVRSS